MNIVIKILRQYKSPTLRVKQCHKQLITLLNETEWNYVYDEEKNR